ncbi:helix-turn-helix transcriptional regulator [Bacillus sp. FJAT-26390]|uniref:helix-turn-helix transcriptional regulator n=1 Tax=Bacillus sp. FJAT-26390 TaxID=1743142 RepID=UPI000807BB1D|nr:AraC family transcriptional regulator [Bacillus sp. FJAT-26390]OBZ11389.1 AraC family transcriptional regulator [Bacillus sp. FJAT-26390]
MKAPWARKRSSKGIMYWKLSALSILLTCLPITIVSAINWNVGNQYLIKQYQHNNEQLLKDTSRQIDDQINQLIQYSLHMIANPIFKSSIASMNFVNEFETTHELSDTLDFIENGYPLIDQAYLYIESQNKVMQSTLGLRSLDSSAASSAWKSIMSEDKGIFWTNKLVRPFNRDDTKNAIVMKLPFNSQKPFGALVLYVNPSKFHLNSNSEQISYVLDGEDTLIGQSDASKEYPNALPGIQKFLSENVRSYDSEFHFRLPVDNDVMLMNTLSFWKLGSIWTYVSGTPASAITAPNQPYKQVVLIYWAISLLIALGVSWFASHRMYKPIRKIVDLFKEEKTKDPSQYNEIEYIEEKWKQHRFAAESLQNQLNTSIPKVREAFINQFVSGQATHLTESEIKEKLLALQLDITDQHFSVIICQPYTLSRDSGQLTAKDDQLLTYASINVLQQLSEPVTSYMHTINFMDSSFAMILFYPASSSSDELKKQLMQLSTDMIHTLRDVLNMKATIIINGPTRSWSNVPFLLEQAKIALNYRSFISDSQLLDAELVLEQVNMQSEFPLELEQEFTHTLNLGLEEESVEILTRLVMALQNGDAPEWVVHQVLMRLKNNLYRVMLQSGHNPYALYDGVKLQKELKALHDSNACIHWFRTNIIKPYIEILNKSYHHSIKHVVDHIITTINENYMSDLSLETFASEAKVSISQLSKAFRQMTGTNYIDYLTSVKINHCKQLLITTDMKIHEIAKCVGYQPPYFNRMFKRLEDLTPGQFREQFK